MQLEVLLAGLATLQVSGATNIEIENITCDSREVTPGSLFVAISGHKVDAHGFVPEAIAAGAVAVVVERPSGTSGATEVVVANGRQALSHLSSRFYGEPSRRFELVGITGTNGKTSVAFILKSILEASGRRTGVIGTAGNLIGDVEVGKESHNTTPGPHELQRLFATMAERGAEVVAMEVTSHALLQHRVDDAIFDVATFTNLTHEHLDYHKDMEGYYQAKARLFQRLSAGQVAVLNADDPYGRRLAQEVAPGVRVVMYGRLGSSPQVRAEEVAISATGTSFKLVTPGGSRQVSLQALPGLYNVSNCLAAAGAATALGVSFDDIVKGLEQSPGAPGRFERVDVGQEFLVIVDYAHTADGFEQVMSTVKQMGCRRLIAIFGSAGERDHAKRPDMGRVASAYCDLIVLTEEDSRTEDPLQIAAEIATGIVDCEYVMVEDRAQAIRYGLRRAEPGDAVLILGKGNETFNLVPDQGEWNGDGPTAARYLRQLQRQSS